MRHTHLVELLNKLRIESGTDSSSNLKILKEKNIPNKSTLNKTKMENVKTGNNAKTVWAKGTGYGANNISDVTNVSKKFLHCFNTYRLTCCDIV